MYRSRADLVQLHDAQTLKMANRTHERKHIQNTHVHKHRGTIKQYQIYGTKHPRIPVPDCTAIFDTFGKLQTHRWITHNTRHIYRQLVTSNICPLCDSHYISKRICQAHITKVCGPRATDQTIRLLTESIVGREEETEKNKYNLRLRALRRPRPEPRGL